MGSNFHNLIDYYNGFCILETVTGMGSCIFGDLGSKKILASRYRDFGYRKTIERFSAKENIFRVKSRCVNNIYYEEDG